MLQGECIHETAGYVEAAREEAGYILILPTSFILSRVREAGFRLEVGIYA
jgi:hypothetical protein